MESVGGGLGGHIYFSARKKGVNKILDRYRRRGVTYFWL